MVHGHLENSESRKTMVINSAVNAVIEVNDLNDHDEIRFVRKAMT